MRGPIFALLMAVLVLGVISLGSLHVVKSHAPDSWRDSTGNELKRVSNWGDSPTEMGQMTWRPRKSILISCPSPEIQKLPLLLDINNVLRRDAWRRNRRSEPARRSHFGTEKTASYRGVTGKGIIGWQKTISQFAIALVDKILRCRVAAVLPDGPKSPIVLVRLGEALLPIRKDRVRENERLLVSNQRLAGEIGLTSSCAPEGEREGSDDHGCESGNRAIVFVDKDSGTLDISPSRARESGWVFFGGIGAVLCMLLCYAAFEGWREKTLRCHQSRNQKQNSRDDT